LVEHGKNIGKGKGISLNNSTFGKKDIQQFDIIVKKVLSGLLNTWSTTQQHGKRGTENANVIV
jgi:hypothetical protein